MPAQICASKQKFSIGETMGHLLARIAVLTSFLICLFIAASGNESEQNKNLQPNDAKANELVSDHDSDRLKRGIISVLAYTGFTVWQLTAAGLTLSSALTGGCSYYPSICTNKEIIERIDTEIKEMKDRYERLYLENKREFIAFREADTANRYIQLYINENMLTLGNLTETESLLYDKLAEQMPELFKQWQDSRNASSEQYITSLLGTLEYSLADIKRNLEEVKRSSWIGIATQFIVLEALGGFVASYTKSYEQIVSGEVDDVMESALWAALFTSEPSEAAIVMDPNHPRHDEIMRKYGARESMTTSMQTKFKNSGKAFKNMFANAKKYFKGLKRGLRKWALIRSWKGFKGKLAFSLQKPKTRLKSISDFITKPSVRKYRVKNFHLDWSDRIMKSIGAFADIVSVALDAQTWYGVKVQMESTRQDYEYYRGNLSSELRNLENEQESLASEWDSVVNAFKELVKPFKEFIENATGYSDLYTALSGTNLVIDLSDPLFSLNLDQVNRNNIAQKQSSINQYLRVSKDDITALFEKYQATSILFQKVEEMSKLNNKVVDILRSVKEILAANPSATVQAFGTRLQKVDILCLIAALHQNKDSYDFYVLSSFRPSCNVNPSDFKRMEEVADRQSKLVLLRSTIEARVNSADTSLEDLLEFIQNTYRVSSDPELQRFGESLTEKEVLCYIASTYPTKVDFDWYDLAAFRPDCSAVSNAEFAQMKAKADQRKRLVSQIRTIVTVCRLYRRCPCISAIAAQTQETEENVKAVLRHEWDQSSYCGSPDCSCVNLK